MFFVLSGLYDCASGWDYSLPARGHKDLAQGTGHCCTCKQVACINDMRFLISRRISTEASKQRGKLGPTLSLKFPQCWLLGEWFGVVGVHPHQLPARHLHVDISQEASFWYEALLPQVLRYIIMLYLFAFRCSYSEIFGLLFAGSIWSPLGLHFSLLWSRFCWSCSFSFSGVQWLIYRQTRGESRYSGGPWIGLSSTQSSSSNSP